MKTISAVSFRIPAARAGRPPGRRYDEGCYPATVAPATAPATIGMTAIRTRCRAASTTCRHEALAFRGVTDGFDADDVPGTRAELTGYELWDRTQRAGRQVAAACARMIAAPSAPARVALAPDFLRPMRRLLELRLVAVAGDRRRAFPRTVPSAGHGVAALWAEVFWTARARSPDDDSGVLEATDASIRGLLTLQPADLTDPSAVQSWWERLVLVEETFEGLGVEAQVTLDGLRETH